MKIQRDLVRIWLLGAAMLPATVQAQFSFTNNNGAISITGYTGFGGAVTIPGTVSGLLVNTIEANAFAGCGSLNSITIPTSVTNIGSFAFADCTNLISVFLGGSPPTADTTIFSNDAIASVYYQQGTTGWSATYAGIPTVLAPYLYTTTNGVITITGYAGSGGAVSIPGMVGGLRVAVIGPNAFTSCASLTGLTIPDSVVYIGNNAFYSCTNLTSVTIGNGVTNIPTQAFYNCTSLTNITFGNGFTSIGNYAFEYCSSLTNLTIPASVYSIGSFAFVNCPNLIGAYFQGNAPAESGTAFSSDSYAVVYYFPGTTGWHAVFSAAPTALTNPPVPFNYTTNNGAITITAYTGSGGIVTIPNTIYDIGANNFLPVTSIGANAFSGCTGLISVAIPNSVTNLGNHAFAGCTNLLGAFFGSNAPSADSTVFLDDTNALAYFYHLPIPGGQGHPISTLGGIPTVLLPYNYAINNGAMNITGYTGSGGAVTIPGMIGGLPIMSIGNEAFYQSTNLTSVTIPNNVTNLGHGAFAFCGNLTTVTLPDHLVSVGIGAFWNCTNLASVTMGTNAASMGISEFDSCASLTSLTIPDSVLKIGSSALQNCSGLTNVTIGKGVVSIGNNAFDSCSNMAEIEVDPQNINYGSVDGVLVNKGLNQLIQCPGGKTGSYTIPNCVSNIGNGVFNDCIHLTGVTIPGSAISIGDWAFSSCSGLDNVTIGKNVISIGSYAFESCSSLMSVIIPDNVTTIGYHAFDDCTSLTDVTIGSGLTKSSLQIISGDFSDCPNLTSIYLMGAENSVIAPYFVWIPTNAVAMPTAYYLPGANLSFVSGIPTAPWLPQILARDGSFGFQANQFSFNIAWASGWTVALDACTDLAQAAWSPVAYSTITNGLSYFSDPQWTNYPNRFYRIRGLGMQQ
jgi:hypothetical protein